MATVSREQHLVGALPRKQRFPPLQAPIEVLGLDRNLVLALRKGLDDAMRQTKAPLRVVVGRPVRNPLRPIGQRKEMGTKLLEAHPAAKAHAEVQDVQV